MVIHLIPVLLAAAAVKVFTDSDDSDSDDESPPPPPVTRYPPPRPPPYQPPLRRAPPPQSSSYRPPPRSGPPPQSAPNPQPPPSVDVVLNRLHRNVGPRANESSSFPTENVTPETLAPVINNIVGEFRTEVNNVRQLRGKPANVILASADGSTTLNAARIGDILGPIVNRLFMEIDEALLTSGDLYAAVREQFVPLGRVMLDLVNVVVHLVDGALNNVRHALGPVLHIINELGLGDVVDEILGDSG